MPVPFLTFGEACPEGLGEVLKLRFSSWSWFIRFRVSGVGSHQPGEPNGGWTRDESGKF